MYRGELKMIQENCYWYIDESVPENEQKISAMCEQCHKTKQAGWFWKGKEQGYGDYDVSCSLCKTPIYIRETHAKNQENKTTVQE